MTDPIDPAFRAKMNALAKHLDGFFNGTAVTDSRKVGFALFMFEFEKFDGGRVNYISNADRENMIAAVKEWLARAEGRAGEAGHA